MLPSTLQRTRSSELPPETPTRPKTFTYKNQIPVILSGIDAKCQTWRQVMGELRQHHPSLKLSKVKALAKGDLLVVGDSPQDVLILQTESKMKAVLGKNVRVSIPKAYQITQKKNKCLAVKGVPTDITANELKEFLDVNKITYAKAERLKSKKDGRVLPIFQLEISDPAEAEALLSQNLVTGERTIRTKDAQKKKQNSPNVQTVLGHMLHLTKGVLNTKSRLSGNMWLTTKILCCCSKPKFSPTAQNHTNVSIHSRTAHQICSQCGHPNRPATHVLPQS